MKQLKKKSILSRLLVFVMLAVVGSFFLFESIPDFLKLKEGPKDWATLDFDDNLDGVYVAGTLEFIYDSYCETTNDNRVVSREYIIDAGEKYYMGMVAPKEEIPEAEDLMEASWAYMDGEDDGTMVYAAQFEIEGTIHKMSSDSLELYKQYLDWDSMDSVDQATFLPYYLELNEIGNSPLDSIFMFLMFGFIFWGIALIVIIIPMTGVYQKQVKQFIAKSGNPDMTREKVESFLANTKENKGLRYDSQFICGQSGAKTIFQDVTKLAWVYLKTITHRRNFITVGHSYYVVLGFVDGKRYSINMKNEETALQYIQELSVRFPNVVAGYSDDLDKMFSKDLNAFLQLKYYASQDYTNQQA